MCFFYKFFIWLIACTAFYPQWFWWSPFPITAAAFFLLSPVGGHTAIELPVVEAGQLWLPLNFKHSSIYLCIFSISNTEDNKKYSTSYFVRISTSSGAPSCYKYLEKLPVLISLHYWFHLFIDEVYFRLFIFCFCHQLHTERGKWRIQ